MTAPPPRQTLVRLTGAGTAAIGAVAGLAAVADAVVGASALRGVDLVILVAALGYGGLGALVARRSIGAIRGAAVLGGVLLVAQGVRGASAISAVPVVWLVLPLALAAVHAGLLTTYFALYAERKAARPGRRVGGGRSPWPAHWPGPLDDHTLDAATRRRPHPYPHPMPQAVREAHTALVRRVAAHEIRLGAVLGAPATVLFFTGLALGGFSAGSTVAFMTTVGLVAELVYVPLANRARWQRWRHRALLLEYGVLVDWRGREVR